MVAWSDESFLSGGLLGLWALLPEEEIAAGCTMQGFFRFYEGKFKTFLKSFLRPSNEKSIYYFCQD